MVSGTDAASTTAIWALRRIQLTERSPLNSLLSGLLVHADKPPPSQDPATARHYLDCPATRVGARTLVARAATRRLPQNQCPLFPSACVNGRAFSRGML